MRTVWVLGDQLNRDLGALRSARPGTDRVLMVESVAKLRSKPWHLQRAHLVITGLRRFAAELRSEGFDVDVRPAPTLAAGLRAHRAEHRPSKVVATEPASWDGWRMLDREGVELVRTDQFLCHPDEFAAWAAGRRSFTMEAFYRWQRRRLGYLMDGDEPAGGRWNHDHENRQPPPRDGRTWPVPLTTPLDDVDRAVLTDLAAVAGSTLTGAPPDGTWATSRAEALRRLDHAVSEILPRFGPHEDAMLSTSWHLAHTLLSPYLNLGLLHPTEVCDAAEAAYRDGRVPIASAEGFIRQIIGWREYVWGLYWLWMPEYRTADELRADQPLPPAFTGTPTRMRCLSHVLADIHDHAWTHHIQRLMVLGNLGLLAGVRPSAVVDWMWASFVDGAEWVMLPNVIGMALHADGGRMATKPYAGGGAYIDRMSDYCGPCHYDRRARTGDRACPFTNLYWDFIDRHRDRFARNPRMAQIVRNLDRLADLPEIREQSVQIRSALVMGER